MTLMLLWCTFHFSAPILIFVDGLLDGLNTVLAVLQPSSFSLKMKHSYSFYIVSGFSEQQGADFHMAQLMPLPLTLLLQ